MLLFGNLSLASIVEESTPGKGYPSTSDDKPIMLFSRENNNVILPAESELPKFPVFGSSTSVENVANQAKMACSIGYVYKRRIDKLASCSKLSQNAVNMFTKFLSAELTKVLEKCQRSKDFTKIIGDTVIAIERSENLVRHILKKFGHQTGLEINIWKKDLDSKSKELLAELAPAIMQLHQRYVKEDCLRGEWDNSTRRLWCPWNSRASQRATILIERLRDGWQHLLRDRATRNLTYNDEQFHLLERIKVTYTGHRLKTLLEVECMPRMTQRLECLADWYKMAQTIFLQTQILDKDVDNYERMLEAYSYRLSRESAERYETQLHSLEKISGKQRVIEKTSMPKQDNTKKWKNISDIHEQITMILSENGRLIDQVDRLTTVNALESAEHHGQELHL